MFPAKKTSKKWKKSIIFLSREPFLIILIFSLLSNNYKMALFSSSLVPLFCGGEKQRL
jgi:hypothetical protein